MVGRDRTSSTGSIGSTGSFCSPSNGNNGLGIDVKVDWIIKAIKELKNRTTCKNKIKS